MRFTPLREGFITRLSATKGPGSIVAGPRTVLLPDGDLLCSGAMSSGLGANDFTPMLYRSTDGGDSWEEQGVIWPHLQARWSIFVSISRDAEGRLFLFGSRTPIDRPNESFWSDATQGLKANELIWAGSTDGGRTWTEPVVIP